MRTIEHKQYIEIVADEGKYLNRVANEIPSYFKRGSMLNGESEASFEEVDEAVKLAFDKEQEETMKAEIGEIEQ